ncbi:PREDICTED: leucine-rich repeat extensin-like protein 1 [Camelina sativa]|uniref:Leucine-rich repeat extensin-like protein 1 n=1 Tax=Camelina sativa TaxID=90675 RepID=A0ABM0YIK4_CAMSA|nr:PREDICTED: leucine-rich repeat extensin-like protein 1 [Camelina sativa]
MGNSPVSALVLADNNLGGCIPGSIGQMGKTLNELILSNDNLTGCLPPQIGNLKKVTVFDISSNSLQGPLPSSIGNMKSLEELHVANNGFAGIIPPSICQLTNLENFTYSSNFFTGRPPVCAAGSLVDAVVNGSMNCIIGLASQRSAKQCSSLLARPVDCIPDTSSTGLRVLIAPTTVIQNVA